LGVNRWKSINRAHSPLQSEALKLLKSSFWLHSIFYTLLQRFSLFFFGAVSYMLLVRAFGEDKASMAVWALYLTILSLFETVKQGMLRNPTIKFLGMTEYADKRKEVQSSALAINVGFTIIIIVLILFCSGLFATFLKAPQLTPLLWWSIVMVILLVPFNHYEVLLQANYQFRKIFWSYLVRQGIFFTGVVVLYFGAREYFTLLNLVWLQVLALLAGTGMMFMATSAYRLRGYHHDMYIMRQMFHFGKYIFGTNLFSNIARSLDHFVTANTLDPVTGKTFVSYYNASARINNMIDVPALAAADVMFPKNVETLETDGLGKVKYYFERMMGTILALVVPLSLFIFFFPKFVLNIVTGPKYLDAALILQITIIANLVRPLGYHFGSTLDAIGKPVVNFWTNAVMMIISLVITYLCLLHFQGMGAAYALIIYNSITLVVMLVILKKYIHLEILNIPRYMFNSYKEIFGFARRLLRRPKTSL
jgi:lipopolysaccharide exporter